MKSWSWLLIILLVIFIKWASWYPGWVEQNYTYGIYPLISEVQRLLLGWIPVSIGDLFYIFLGLVIIYKTVQLVKVIRKKKFNRNYLVEGMQQLFFFFLLMYVLFNLLWGLNYNRRGIAHQSGFIKEKYTTADIDTLSRLLLLQLNTCAAQVNDSMRKEFKKKPVLFEQTEMAFKNAATAYPYLNYQPVSLKPSLFSYLGNIMGFQGYYNPFSGEAQVNTTVPGVLEPFVAAHEVAHQIGYGKENEASFAAYLAVKEAPSVYARYSLYFNMYLYALGELQEADTVKAKEINRRLHPVARKDYVQVKTFYRKYKNPVEKLVSLFYNSYLKANNQPQGRYTYNDVVNWLIAYYKKNGKV